MKVASPTPPAGTKRRAHAIDLLRLLAAVQMISGHTIDALIAPEHRAGSVWAWWTWIRGLTAVAFLFASGVSFAMVAAQSPERRGPRLRRAGQLIAISYALHPPVALFSADAALRDASLRELFAVDVLACIGVTLLVLELIAARLPARAFAPVSGALGVVALLTAPLGASLQPTGIAMSLLDYVTKAGGSLFPLLPFSGFALLGASVGTVARPREPGWRAASVFAASSAACLLAAAIGRAVSASPPHELYYAWPVASLSRLGVVLGIALVLTIVTSRVSSLPAWTTKLAGETLFLYVSHLLALYVGGVGLVHFLGGSLSLAASIAVSVVLVVACSAGALGWDAYRERRALTAR